MQPALAAILLACAAAAGTSCKPKPVPLKQDTPQATIATLIKVYESKELDRASKLIDPLLARVYARHHLCGHAASEIYDCITELHACLNESPAGSDCGTVSGCTEHVVDGCDKAVSTNDLDEYEDSAFHWGLGVSGISAKSCEILKSYKGSDAFVAYHASYLQEEPMADHFRTVFFKCADKTLAAVLRNRSGTWRIAGFSYTTSDFLAGLALRAGEVANKMLLNEELK